MLMLLAWLAAGISRADVVLPAILSDHMVLERSASTMVWGKGDPGEQVSVLFAGQTGSVQAGGDGRWRIALDLSQCAAGPYEMHVKGRNEIRIQDVVIGDVWVASGQSNMQFSLRGALGAAEDIANSANTMVRHFKVKVVPSLDPQEDCEGRWETARPESVGDFSAVGYHFSKALHKELGIPVGIIDATLGGSLAESWTSQDGLRKNPELGPVAESQWKAAREYPELRKQWESAFAEWSKATNRVDRREGTALDFAAVDASLNNWKSITVPGKLSNAAPGVRWYRRDVEIPTELSGRPLPLVLGEIDGFEEVYWNGTLVGKLTPETHPGAPYPRRYDIPASLLKPGPNVLAIRVFSPAVPGGLSGRVIKLGTLPLMGEWSTRVEYEFTDSVPSRPPVQPRGPRAETAVASSLFNGMIHPILPCTIKGVIWYQGEGNASRASQYRDTFQRLIEDWRLKWSRTDLPFYFCQLANYGSKPAGPEGGGNWAELREAQSLALQLPHTGQAILIDLGEAEAVHPLRKKEVGERLSRIALARTYSRDVPFSGPVMDSSAIEGDKIRVRFAHAHGGLIARRLGDNHDLSIAENRTAPLVRNVRDSELEGFAICGKDGRWVWAQARIEENDVIIWAKEISEPVAVRYAWADNPTANLYNGAGLPAGPFRTDDFPLQTKNRKYQP